MSLGKQTISIIRLALNIALWVACIVILWAAFGGWAS
jgi:hypothetical protein